MCGNQVSTVSSPGEGGQFYKTIAPQIPSRRILLKNYAMSPANGIELSTMNLTGVKELRLQKCRISSQTMQQMAALDMPVLMKLSLDNNELGPTGCRILAASPLISKLVQLSLNNNKIKDIGLKTLTTAQLQFLQDLSLNDNSITSEGVKTLAGKLDSIECLSLASNKIDDTAVATINSFNPQSLFFMKLSRNELSDDGLKKLIDAHQNLDVLLIDRNKIKSKKQNYKKKDLFLFY